MVDGDPPASALVDRDQARRAAPARGGRAAASRWPSRGSTSASTRRRALAYEVREGEYIQIIDVQGQAVLGLPRLPRAQAPERDRARPRRRDHAHADGRRRTRSRASTEVLRRGHGPARGGRARHGRAPRHVRARLHAPSTTRTSATPATSTARRTSTARSRPTASRERKGWEALNFFYNTALDRDNVLIVRRAVVAPGRLRAAAGDDRPRLRVVGVPGRHRPRERLGDHRRPRSRLLAREPLLEGDRPPRDPGGRASADQGDGVPPAHQRADRELRRVPRLLAAALLQQRGRHRRVLGLPREGRGDGPVAAAQVGGARPRRRGAHAAGGHARHPPARGRPGRVHGALQRDRRDDRRRHRLPARPGQLPLRRRRRVRRRVAARAGRAARPEGVGQAVDRPAAQPRGPGPGEPGDHEVAGLDAAHPALDRGAQVVPLPGRADRELRRDARRGVAHRLHGRAGLRGLLPPRRRVGGLGRDLGGRPAARAQAARARGARHDPHRGRADLRRLRVRRPGRPVRGRHRLRGQARLRGRLRRQAGADRALGAPAAGARRPGARGQRDRRARRRGLGRSPAHRRRHERHPLPHAAQEHRPLPDVRAVRGDRHERRGRQARRAAEAHPRARSCASRSTTPTRRARARERGPAPTRRVRFPAQLERARTGSGPARSTSSRRTRGRTSRTSRATTPPSRSARRSGCSRPASRSSRR